MLYIPFPFKRCTKCNMYYPPTPEFFGWEKRRKSIIRSRCKLCHNADNKDYRTSHTTQISEYTKGWKKAHPEKAKKSKRQWAKRFRLSHPDKERIRNAKRKAKRRALPATFKDTDWQNAINYFHGGCAYCGQPPQLWDSPRVLHQDHFIPASKGGGYTPDNIVPACYLCNISKSNKNVEQWMVTYFCARKARIAIKRIQGYFEWIKCHH